MADYCFYLKIREQSINFLGATTRLQKESLATRSLLIKLDLTFSGVETTGA